MTLAMIKWAVIPDVAQRRSGIQELYASPTGTKNAFIAGSRPRGRGTFLCLSKEKYPKEKTPGDVRSAYAEYCALLAGLGAR